MALTQDQVNRITTWMNEKHESGRACPWCGSSQWSIVDMVVAPKYVEGATKLGGQVAPMIQVVCMNCSYVVLFAAVPILGKDLSG